MTNQLHWQRSPQSLTCQCFTATTLSSNQMSSSCRHTVKWNMLHKILFRSGFLDEACQLDGTLPHVFLTCNKASSCLSVTPSPADFHIFVSVEKDCSEGQGKSGSGVFPPVRVESEQEFDSAQIRLPSNCCTVLSPAGTKFGASDEPQHTANAHSRGSYGGSCVAGL